MRSRIGNTILVAAAGSGAVVAVAAAAAVAAVRSIDNATCADTPRGVRVERGRTRSAAAPDTTLAGYY